MLVRVTQHLGLPFTSDFRMVSFGILPFGFNSKVSQIFALTSFMHLLNLGDFDKLDY